MSVFGVNLWAVLAAGVAAMIVGFLWYSPVLFAKPWMALMGYDPSDKAKTKELQKGRANSMPYPSLPSWSLPLCWEK